MDALKRPFRSSGIRRRLFWLLGGLGLGTLLGVNLVWLPSSIREIREAQMELQLVAVRGVRDQIQAFLDEREYALRSQAKVFRPAFLEGDRTALTLHAHRFLQRDLAFEEIGIVDPQGIERFRISRNALPTNPNLRDLRSSLFFREGMRREVFWEPVAITQTSEPWVTVAVPMKLSESSAVGVVFGVLNLKSLWDVTSTVKLSYEGRAYVVDQVGRVIAAQDPKQVLKQLSFADRPPVRQLIQHGHRSGLRPYFRGNYVNGNGVKVMATGLPLPGPSWAVIVEQPESLLYIPVRNKIGFFFVVFFLGLLVSFALAHLLSGRLTRPITRLREGVEQIRKGHLEHRVGVETNDEIGELAAQFNQMTEALNVSYQNLEEKISKRTQEIASLYAGLTPLTQADSIGQMLEKVIERLMETTGADAGLIRIRDRARGIFVYTAQRGFPEYYLRVAARVPPGSAVDQVFTSGDPLISPDIASDPRHRGKVQLKVGLVSSALLPLQVGNEVRGIIHLASREKGYFNEEKREYLMAIARQMGIAMENRELFDGMKRIAQEQAILNSIAMATSQSMDPDELLRVSLDKLLDFTGRERGYTRVKDPVTGDLRVAAYRGISREYAEALVHRRTPGGKADRVFHSGEPLVINDTEEILLREDTRREGNRSIVWIPLKSKGKVLGVLNVSTARPVPFEPREVELLQAIGNVIGVALENSQLFEQTQRAVEVLKSTNRELERSTKEQRALRRFLSDLLLLDLDELLQKLTKQAARLFKAEYVWLRLFDDTGKIRTRAVAGEEDIIQVMSRIPEAGKLSGRGRWMLDHHKPLAVRNIAEETERPSRGVAAGLRGFLGAPLFSKEQKPLGVIHVMTRSPRDFGQRDLDLIEQFANGAAIALENAQLFEQMTRSKKELEKANRVKSYFLGMMSHELRTPLSVIIGNIAILLEKHLGEVNPEQEKRLGIVERNAADLFRMLQGILDICRLEEGKMPVHFEEFTVDGLLNEIRTDFGDTAPNKRVRLEIHGNGAMRPMLSDRMKLKEILQNLLSNAIKFTKEGRIELSVRYSGVDDRIEFTVRDTGIGMTREDLQHIFDVFYQVDSSDQRRFGGAGLGLNIVKRLADLLQGEIRVESEPGEGSMFAIVVPRKIAVSPEAFRKAV